MAIRDTLNAADANRLPAAFSKIGFGDLVNTLMSAIANTESGVAATANVAPLANQPSYLWKVNATAGGVTGVKKLLKGPITGTNAIVPLTGQACWDGAKKVLFATADAVTTAAFVYAQSTDVTCSVLARDLEEQDS